MTQHSGGSVATKTGDVDEVDVAESTDGDDALDKARNVSPLDASDTPGKGDPETPGNSPAPDKPVGRWRRTFTRASRRRGKAANPVVDAENNTVDDGPPAPDSGQSVAPVKPADHRRRRLIRAAFVALPLAAMILAGGAGYLKWLEASTRANELAGVQAVAAAKDIVAAMLSYRPDTVQQDLSSPRERMVGAFKDSYGSLITDVVVPGAKQNRVAATATVPAAAVVSADKDEAVVLVFVDQTTTTGDNPPTNTASSVRVSLQKAGQQWFVSDFVPL